MASNAQNQTLKQKIRIWLGAVILVLGFLIVVSFYWIERNDRQDGTIEQLNRTIALQSTYIERWANERATDMKRIAQSQTARKMDIDHLQVVFKDYTKANSEYSAIYLVSKQGNMVNSTSDNPYVGDREYFKEGQKKRDYVSGVMISKATGNSIITFSSPVLDENDEFIGVIVGFIKTVTIDKLMSNLNIGDTGELYVLDNRGSMVTKSRFGDPVSPDIKMDTAIVQRAMAGSKEKSPYIGYRGEKVFGSYQWSNGHKWVIVGEITEKEVFQSLYQILYTMIGIIVIILLSSYGMVIVLTSRIERPIRYLLKGTKIIEEGNYDYKIDFEKVRSAPRELKQLVETFNLMSNKLKATIELLEHSALIDQLTEIYNRRYVMNEGSKLMESSLRFGQPCSVIMLDIDYFKKINDTYGHLVGDKVLKHFAALLTESAGSGHITARYGGEEFIIVAINSDAMQSKQMAEQIRQRVANEPYQDDKLTVALTVSIGVAQYSEQVEFGTTILEDMVSRADEALYQAKASGRNRVVVDPKSAAQLED